MKNKHNYFNREDVLAFIFLSILTLVIILIIDTNVHVTNNKHENNFNNYINVYVVKGDTLWNIAEKYNTKYNDIRKFIYEIKYVNNMDTSMIKQGQIIKVPVN